MKYVREDRSKAAIMRVCALFVALFMWVVPAQAQEIINEIGQISAPNLLNGDNFGFSIDVDGDRMVVGAPAMGIDNGAAYVYTRGNDAWKFEAALVPSELSPNARFGLSVSLDGDRVLIGANADNSLKGSAFIFARNSDGTWSEEVKLQISQGFRSFGASVSLEGDRALIGASSESFGGAYSVGAAYFYERDNIGNWNQVARIVADDFEGADFFGYSVALAGNTAIIGSRQDDTSVGDNSGSGYIFELIDGTWTQTQKLIPSTAGPSNLFGNGVDIDGDRAAIVTSSGSTTIYDKEDGIWIEKGSFLGSSLGNAKVNGNQVLAGSSLFEYVDGAWIHSTEFDPTVAGLFPRANLGAFTDGAVVVSYSNSSVEPGTILEFPLSVGPIDTDNDGYTDAEEEECGTNPNDDTDFPRGSVAGVVTAGSTGQPGITVELHDMDGNLIADTKTNDSGSYGFSDVPQGDVVVSVIAPLGYDEAPDVYASVLCNEEATANIDLGGQIAGNMPRRAAYWQHNLNLVVAGRGHPRETETDFNLYITEIQNRFNTYFPALFGPETDGVNDISDWNDLFNVRGTTGVAKAQYAALLLNVVSKKLDQFSVVTVDGRRVSDVLSYGAQLIQSGGKRDLRLAKKLAELVIKGKLIKAGVVPGVGIAYEQGGRGLDTLGPQSTQEALPESYALEGNYPNPFNPATTIRFALPESTQVTLTVYNTLGQQVAVLADGIYAAGHHEVAFDAQDLPSGTYLYQIKTPAGNYTKTMLLMK